MSLKRKSSFSAMAPLSVTPVVAGPSVAMDDAPHLSSRTRKRFRDDRPDEKTVYGNTLRWLYTAQQRQTSISTSCIDINEINEYESENINAEAQREQLPTPETTDPRQQTLFKFFKPAQAPSTPPHPSSHHTSRRPDNTNGFVRPFSFAMSSPMGNGDSYSPDSRTPGTDMDIDMSD